MTATAAAVTVVGGGIGGATLALALARRGIDVTVIEQAPAFKPLYKGEYLQPASLETFAQLGLADAIRAVTYPVYVTRVGRDTGQTLMEIDLRELGEFEGRNGHHRQIQGAVLGALASLPNVRVQMGVRLTGLCREPDGWRLTTTAGDLRTRVIVGADGRRSAVRKLLGIDAVERPYPGAALAVTVDLSEEPAHRFEQLYGAQDSAFCFPLPNRQARLYLGLREDRDYEAMRAQPDGGLALLKERLGVYFPTLRPSIGAIESMQSVQVIPSYYLMAERWTMDGAALLGDAAHCVNPARGQGMNLAIADARELAGVLAQAVGRCDVSAAALAPYEQRRRPHVRYIQMDGERARWLFSSSSRVVRWLRDRIFRNTMQARRATRLLLSTFAGLHRPPTALEDMLMTAAFALPALDRLVPEA